MTRQYLVIGDPIAHSRSPLIYNTLFSYYGLDARYSILQVPAGAISQMLPQLRQLAGFNITMPHKRAILPFLATISSAAKAAQSVNTVKVDCDGSLHGHSTDGEGFARALQAAGRSFAQSNVVLLGAGGAAEAAAWRAVMEARCLTIAARSVEKAATLCKRVASCSRCTVTPAAIDQLPLETLQQCDVFINATPQGMVNHPSFPNLDFLHHLRPGAIICDMVYEPARTHLLLQAERLGFPTMPGLPMLLWQALIAFEIFTGVHPDQSAFARVQQAICSK